MLKYIKALFKKLLDRASPARKLIVILGDSLPARMPWRNLILAKDDGEDWCVGMRCPCGCGRIIELLVIPEANPRWSLSVDPAGRPTLQPSVWLRDGCRSHFWMRNGRVEWCD